MYVCVRSQFWGITCGNFARGIVFWVFTGSCLILCIFLCYSILSLKSDGFGMICNLKFFQLFCIYRYDFFILSLRTYWLFLFWISSDFFILEISFYESVLFSLFGWGVWNNFYRAIARLLVVCVLLLRWTSNLHLRNFFYRQFSSFGERFQDSTFFLWYASLL